MPEYTAILRDGIPTYKEKRYEISGDQLDRIIAVLLENQRRFSNQNVRHIMPPILLHNLAVEIEDLRRLRDNPKKNHDTKRKNPPSLR